MNKFKNWLLKLHIHQWVITRRVVAFLDANKPSKGTYMHTLNHPFKTCKICNKRQSLSYGKWI